MNIICESLSVCMHFIWYLVVWATGLVIAIFCPAILFNRVDFPTFGLPTIATVGLLIHFTSFSFISYSILFAKDSQLL